MIILYDTREKFPWTFGVDQYVDDVLKQKLSTGDYTLRGYESRLCIERKKTVSELAQNITTKRFHNELERMKQFEWAFLILEFSVSDILNYPSSKDVPKHIRKKLRVKGPFILKCLAQMQTKYGVFVLPCDNTFAAQHVALDIMKNVWRYHNDKT